MPKTVDQLQADVDAMDAALAAGVTTARSETTTMSYDMGAVAKQRDRVQRQIARQTSGRSNRQIRIYSDKGL